MHELSITNCVVGVLCAATLTSCSWAIGTDERQCKTAADCIEAKLGTLCVEQVCVNTNSGCVGEECTTSRAASDGKCKNDDQCNDSSTPRCFNGSCVERELAERWICTADDQTIKTNTIRYGFRVVDFVSRVPPKDVVVNACRSNDVGCVEPVATYMDRDGTGHAQFELPSGFFGFFEIKSAAVPTLMYVTKPIVRNTENRDLPILTREALQLTASIADMTLDMTKGLALLEALDCSNTPAGGIQFTLGGEPTGRFYLVDQIPSFDATVTVYDEVNNTANGGFVNVEPGFVTFNARLGTDGMELGSFNAQIRASTITFINMHF
jgi:hypothetical protein